MNPGWAGRAARKEAVCGTLRDSRVGTPPGKLHPEQGALRACFSPDLAPVSGHDGRDDREAEPGATRGTVARLVYPIEPFEHAIRLLFAQAGTFVFDCSTIVRNTRLDSALAGFEILTMEQDYDFKRAVDPTFRHNSSAQITETGLPFDKHIPISLRHKGQFGRARPSRMHSRPR